MTEGLENLRKIAEGNKPKEEDLSGFFELFKDGLNEIFKKIAEFLEELKTTKELLVEYKDKDNKPTNEELLELITPLIPAPEKGEDGTDYILTEKDKKDIAKTIKVPVVEKIIREIPMITEIAMHNTPEETRDKLESLTKGNKLTINAIEELADILKGLSVHSAIGGDHRVQVHSNNSLNTIRFVDDETPSGTVDGSNADFVISKTPRKGSLKVYRGGARQRITEDYTLAGKTITFIVAPQVGEILLVDLRY